MPVHETGEKSEALIQKAGARFDSHPARLKVKKEVKVTTLKEKMDSLWAKR